MYENGFKEHTILFSAWQCICEAKMQKMHPIQIYGFHGSKEF